NAVDCQILAKAANDAAQLIGLPGALAEPKSRFGNPPETPPPLRSKLGIRLQIQLFNDGSCNVLRLKDLHLTVDESRVCSHVRRPLLLKRFDLSRVEEHQRSGGKAGGRRGGTNNGARERRHQEPADTPTGA